MQSKRKELSLPVVFETLTSQNAGWILLNPATFKLNGEFYKVALQGGGLTLVSVDRPNKLVNVDLSVVLAEAAEETLKEE